MTHIRAALEQAMLEANIRPKPLSLRLKAKHNTGETLIRDILTGRSSNPRLKTLAIIADELGKPLEFFLQPGSLAHVIPMPPQPVLDAIAEVFLALASPGLQPAAPVVRAWALALRDALLSAADQPDDAADPRSARAMVRGAMSRAAREAA